MSAEATRDHCCCNRFGETGIESSQLLREERDAILLQHPAILDQLGIGFALRPVLPNPIEMACQRGRNSSKRSQSFAIPPPGQGVEPHTNCTEISRAMPQPSSTASYSGTSGRQNAKAGRGHRRWHIAILPSPPAPLRGTRAAGRARGAGCPHPLPLSHPVASDRRARGHGRQRKLAPDRRQTTLTPCSSPGGRGERGCRIEGIACLAIGPDHGPITPARSCTASPSRCRAGAEHASTPLGHGEARLHRATHERPTIRPLAAADRSPESMPRPAVPDPAREANRPASSLRDRPPAGTAAAGRGRVIDRLRGLVNPRAADRRKIRRRSRRDRP